MLGQPLAIMRGPRAVMATQLIDALDRQSTEATLPVGPPELVVGLPEPVPEAAVGETGKKPTLTSQSTELPEDRTSGWKAKDYRSNCSIYRYSLRIKMRRGNLYIHS
jgi:hypothetical protein